MLSAAYSESATSSGARSSTEPAVTCRSRTSPKPPRRHRMSLVRIQLVVRVDGCRSKADGRARCRVGKLVHGRRCHSGTVGRHDVFGEQTFRVLPLCCRVEGRLLEERHPGDADRQCQRRDGRGQARALMPAVRPCQEPGGSQSAQHCAQGRDPDPDQQRSQETDGQDRCREDARVAAGATGPLTEAATLKSTAVPATAARPIAILPTTRCSPGRAGSLEQRLDRPGSARSSRGGGTTRVERNDHGGADGGCDRDQSGLGSEAFRDDSPGLHAAGQVRGEHEARPHAHERTERGHVSMCRARSSDGPVAWVAPMARSRAISRWRCWTNIASIPAITRMATNMPMPPSDPLIAISRRAVLRRVEELGLARARRRSVRRRRRPSAPKGGGDLRDIGAGLYGHAEEVDRVPGRP